MDNLIKIGNSEEKRPSEELISLITELRTSIKNAKSLVRKIKKRGHEEGFSDFEIVLFAREILRPSLSRRQLNYWLPTRNNSEKRNYPSANSTQIVNNVDKKDTLQLTGSSSTHLEPSNIITSNIMTSPVEKKTLSSFEDRYISKSGATDRVITYTDLLNPQTIDCTNHPMYRKACETIQQFKVFLPDKSRNVQIKNDGKWPSTKSNPISADIFFVAKDCDFKKEHFKAQIELKRAIEYLQKFVGVHQKIDFAFRVIE